MTPVPLPAQLQPPPCPPQAQGGTLFSKSTAGTQGAVISQATLPPSLVPKIHVPLQRPAPAAKTHPRSDEAQVPTLRTAEVPQPGSHTAQLQHPLPIGAAQRSDPSPPLQLPLGFRRMHPPMLPTAVATITPSPVIPLQRTAKTDARHAGVGDGLVAKLPSTAPIAQKLYPACELSDLEVFWDAEQGDSPVDGLPGSTAAAQGRGLGPVPCAPAATLLAKLTEEHSPAAGSHAQLAGDERTQSDVEGGDDSPSGELAAQEAKGQMLPETLEVYCGHARGTFVVQRMCISCRCSLCDGRVRADCRVPLLSTLAFISY